MSCDVSDKISVIVEGVNLFNEPKQQCLYTNDNLGEVNVSGGQHFLGIRGKL